MYPYMYPADTGTLHLLASTFRKLMIFVNLLSVFTRDTKRYGWKAKFQKFIWSFTNWAKLINLAYKLVCQLKTTNIGQNYQSDLGIYIIIKYSQLTDPIRFELRPQVRKLWFLRPPRSQLHMINLPYKQGYVTPVPAAVVVNTYEFREAEDPSTK